MALAYSLRCKSHLSQILWLLWKLYIENWFDTFVTQNVDTSTEQCNNVIGITEPNVYNKSFWRKTYTLLSELCFHVSKDICSKFRYHLMKQHEILLKKLNSKNGNIIVLLTFLVHISTLLVIYEIFYRFENFGAISCYIDNFLTSTFSNILVFFINSETCVSNSTFNR